MQGRWPDVSLRPPAQARVAGQPLRHRPQARVTRPQPRPHRQVVVPGDGLPGRHRRPGGAGQVLHCEMCVPGSAPSDLWAEAGGQRARMGTRGVGKDVPGGPQLDCQSTPPPAGGGLQPGSLEPPPPHPGGVWLKKPLSVHGQCKARSRGDLSPLGSRRG